MATAARVGPGRRRRPRGSHLDLLLRRRRQGPRRPRPPRQPRDAHRAEHPGPRRPRHGGLPADPHRPGGGVSLAAGSVTLAIALGVAGLVLFLAVRYGGSSPASSPATTPRSSCWSCAGPDPAGRGHRAAAPGVRRGRRVPRRHRPVRRGRRRRTTCSARCGTSSPPSSSSSSASTPTPPASRPSSCPLSPWPWSPPPRRSPPATGPPSGPDLPQGRWRAGGTLVARGEFSIVIAGLAVTAASNRRSARWPRRTSSSSSSSARSPPATPEPVATRLTGRFTRGSRNAPMEMVSVPPPEEMLDPVEDGTAGRA